VSRLSGTARPRVKQDKEHRRAQDAENGADRDLVGVPDHPSEKVSVAPGATFSLRLITTPRPGFTWRVECDGSLLAVVEERFVPPEAGEPAGHLVRVAARGEGESTLRCLYARPWDTEPVEVRTYEVRIAP
jgi:predicted secreted protein